MSSPGAARPSTASTASSDADHVLFLGGSETSEHLQSSFTEMDEGASGVSHEGDRDFHNRIAGMYGGEGRVHAGPAGVNNANGVERLPQHETPLADEERLLPTRERCDVSDSNINSPWARKTVLTLDGGGVKGYSSLLILKRVMKLIAEIETGKRPASHDETWCWEPIPSSAHYPWFRGEPHHEPAQTTPVVKDDVTLINDERSDEEIEWTCKDTNGTKHFLPRHYFDYMAGTSTGGLSAIMLGRLRMSIDDALAQYDIVGNQVFGKPRLLHRQLGFLNYATPKYRSRDMKKAILEVVRNGMAEELCQWDMPEDEAPLESDSVQCRTLAIAYGHHVRKGVKKDYMFRSYDHPAPSPLAKYQDRPLNPGRAHREPLWKIARATSAAPRYFSSISFSSRIFRDGGMGANNPAELALWEVLQMHEHPPSVLVSLGTGKPEGRPQKHRLKDRLKGSHAESRPQVQKGLIKIRGDLEDVVALATESEKTEVRVGRDCNLLKVDYFRLNVQRDMGRIMLDNWEPAVGGTTTKDDITKLTNQYLRNSSVNDELLKCARMLVKIRRARAKTERWERFAAQYVYFCPENDCNSPNNKYSKTYFERNELREHGINEHFAVLGTPIENGLAYTIACTHDSCVHKVHIFHSKDQLLRHFEEHHRRTKFKNAQEIEHWLDSGRMSQPEALRFRASMRDELQWMSQRARGSPGLANSNQGTGTRSTPERDQNPADLREGTGLTSNNASTFQLPIKIRLQSFRRATHPAHPP